MTCGIYTAEKDICVGDIGMISGTRPAGKTVDVRQAGRSHHGFLYLMRGEARFSPSEGVDIRAQTGDVVLLPKGARYTMRYTADQTAFILVNCELLSAKGEAVSFTDRISVWKRKGTEERIADLFLKMEECRQRPCAGAVFLLKSYFFQLLFLLFDGEDPFLPIAEYPKFAHILPGVRLLRERYTERISIPELAAACHISVSSFRELFTAQYGQSPLRYRNQLRVEKAKSLLESGNYTVSEAAYAAGFQNLGYFYRCYQKVMGEAPRRALLSDV